ncbi:MAG: hypothetical protein NZM40_03720 [Sphingomonadaceae bacterium]|nr:hypothetical protein [Sphingomonadaceae bacterium]MDW8414207.1 hypothetical protein [Thermaurantiacus sp.]
MRAATIALTLTLVTVAPAQASQCWAPDALEALRLRDMQVMLQVGALRCRATDPEIVRAYNRFIERSRERLVRGEERLARHFAVDSGRGTYDRFFTDRANLHAEALQSPGRCGVIARILAADDAAKGGLAEAVAALPVVPVGAGRPCTGERQEEAALPASPFAPLPE